jgi:hypothetical protein
LILLKLCTSCKVLIDHMFECDCCLLRFKARTNGRGDCIPQSGF